jgi:hypothetical protein
VWKCGLYFLAGALEKRSTSEANGVRRSTNFASVRAMRRQLPIRSDFTWLQSKIMWSEMRISL